MDDISIDLLSASITAAVREYTDDVSRAIEKKVDSVANDVLEDIQANAPKRTGKYAKGFKKTNQTKLQGGRRYVIWNKENPRISHLLEFGHAKRGGGRVAARPHIRPAYDRHAANLPDDIKRIIRNGGGT